MFRRHLIDLLPRHDRGLHDGSRAVDIRTSDLEDDLQRLFNNLWHRREYHACISPAGYRRRGFV